MRQTFVSKLMMLPFTDRPRCKQIKTFPKFRQSSAQLSRCFSTSSDSTGTLVLCSTGQESEWQRWITWRAWEVSARPGAILAVTLSTSRLLTSSTFSAMTIRQALSSSIALVVCKTHRKFPGSCASAFSKVRWSATKSRWCCDFAAWQAQSH
jgi:hypothetical protein